MTTARLLRRYIERASRAACSPPVTPPPGTRPERDRHTVGGAPLREVCDGLYKLVEAIRLKEKAASARQFFFLDPPVSRRHENVDRRPSVSNGVRQPKAVHRSRHIDVGDNHFDIDAGREEFDRLVGVFRAENLEAGILKVVNHQPSEEVVIFDDEHNGARLPIVHGFFLE
jgi:hypothetical protein